MDVVLLSFSFMITGLITLPLQHYFAQSSSCILSACVLHIYFFPGTEREKNHDYDIKAKLTTQSREANDLLS
jgi:hypothetical protein